MANIIWKNKKKMFVAVAILVIVFVLASRLSKKQSAEAQPAAKAPQSVSVQSAADSATLTQSIQYPAVVAGEDEIAVTAKSAGNAATVNFNLGSKVALGTLLVKIDDTGNNLKVGDKGFRSSDVQQSTLSKEQAQETLDKDKKFYKDLKKAYDQQKKDATLAKTVTKAQVDAANEQIDIDQIALDSTKIGLKGTLDDHLVTSPITGIVTSKSVDVGDSISSGQELATISKTALTKVQFFVAKEDLSNFQAGTKVTITEDGTDISGVVARIAPQADPTTKRFLVEAKPVGGATLVIGTVISVSFEAVRTPSAAGDLLLPLSAITVGQNENYIFLAKNNQAKKTDVTIVKVRGEFAEVKADISADAKIIINGSKLVSDSGPIQIQN
jgi:RND family efflux transporter MFP subunit